jgi:hypothetical protein
MRSEHISIVKQQATKDASHRWLDQDGLLPCLLSTN